MEFMQRLDLPEGAQARRNEVILAIIEATDASQTIKLPPFDPDRSVAADGIAGSTVGIEPNPYGGVLGDFRYQFEGEEDLLHLIITRRNGGELSIEEGQWVADFLLSGVPKALIWFKHGTITQHFYLGHDDLVRYAERG